jgi:RHS repeat-associated protein
MDYMIYSYKGNQLTRVKEEGNNYFGFTTQIAQTNAAEQYGYDANGNMTSDANKSISSITYNHLNLPLKIAFASAGNISYIYNAAGQKVQKRVGRTGVSNDAVTDYLDGFQYENASLQFFPMAEGYVEPSAGSYRYIYQYKDHLGNVRLSYDRTLAIKEESNYYPFGMKHEGYNAVKIGVENKYKYNGKELQDESIGGSQLNWYDYGARNYDPALGRWINIDPLAEKKFDFTPYRYAYNNPMKFIDPDGMLEDDYGVDKDGNFQLLKPTGDDFDRVYVLDDNGNKKDLKDKNGKDIKDYETVAKGILNQMTEDRPIIKMDDDGSLKAPSSATSDNNKKTESDYSNLFKFVADNTRVEFGLTFYKSGNQSKVSLSTLHDIGYTFSPATF